MANAAAEFGLLAGLCNNPDLYFKLQQFISIEDFNNKAHRNFFTVLQRLILNSSGHIIVTQPGLLAEASALGIGDFYESCRDGELIEACLDHQSDERSTMQSFKLVKGETTKTKYAEFMKRQLKYLSETTDDVADMIDTVDSGLLDLSGRLQGVIDDEIIHLPSTARQVINELAESPGELGVSIGLPIWQRAIGGLRNGTVTFICATAKAGKSQLGVRAALEVSKIIPVLYCDSELDETSQSVRACGMFNEVNYEILETGYWKSDEAKILADGYDKTFATACKVARGAIEDDTNWAQFDKCQLYYKKMTGMTAREVLPFLRRWFIQHVGLHQESRVPRCLIVYDYIKLARVDEVIKLGVGAHDVIGDACMALHDFAEEFSLPILAFGQTNRQMDIDINMIAGAKKIVELVDSASLLRLKDADDLSRDPVGTHELHNLVSRHGRGLSTHVNIKADLGIGKFEELGIAKLYIPNKTEDDDDSKKSNKN